MSSQVRPVSTSVALVIIALAACTTAPVTTPAATPGATRSGQVTPFAIPSPVVSPPPAPPAATPAPVPAPPQGPPAPTPTPPPVPVSAPVSTSLSFDVFGVTKRYPDVTARIETVNGQARTIIQAADGPDSLSVVVAGTGPGEHPIESVDITDRRLGENPLHFDRHNPRLEASAAFTRFEPDGGIVAGTFQARHRGVPPVHIRDGKLTARLASPTLARR